jgi:hypothetical protein
MLKIKHAQPEEVVKEAFWLAWKACGGPLGMGAFQNRPQATKDEVWECVRSARDYGPGAAKLMGSDKPGEAYGDYVFGRMMKLELKWDSKSIEYSDSVPRGDYQAWCRQYPTYQALVEAAVKSLSETQ